MKLYDFEKPILVIDVETPNRRNDSICAIGTVKLCKDRPAETFYTLVNPECEFDDHNIDIHGITSTDVSDAPTWKEVWHSLSTDFESCILVAHNASFDLNVINKTSKHYGISLPELEYICTFKIARDVFPQAPNYKLSTLADLCSIDLKHHNAGSDSLAAAELLQIYIDSDVPISDYISTYKISEQQHYRCMLSENSQSLKELINFVEAFRSSGLKESHIKFLNRWLNAHSHLAGQYPFDDILAAVNSVLLDGVIDDFEIEHLSSLFAELCDPVNTVAFCGDISIKNKSFCLTGDFNFGTRAAVENYLCSLGGICSKNVTKKTDLVIVGEKGSDSWCTGNYGNKLKRALELQKQGSDILIIRENDFLTSLEDDHATSCI